MPLSKLNSQQSAAVISQKGVIRVIAAAGSGKTTVIRSKIHYEIQRGMRPNKILALTFTKKAGMELRSRLKSVLGMQADKIFAGTFHSFAHQHLCKVLTYSLVTDNDMSDMLEHIMEQYGETEYKTQDVMRLLGYHRNLQKPYTDPLLQKIELEYKQSKIKNNLKDYDDLLEDFLTLLKKKFFKLNYDLIICDENQDSSGLQVSILKELLILQSTPNIFLVGDGMQSIFGFRGADVSAFLAWDNQGAIDYPLAVNYRSSKEIIKIANKVLSLMPGKTKVEMVPIKTNEAPPVKIAKVGNAMDEVIYVTDKIRELHAQGQPYHSIAILYRAHYLSTNLQLKLAELRIPYNVWSGTNVLTAQHIKDCICFLRAYTNPRDVVAWARIFRLLPKIGKVNGQKMAEAVVRSGIHAYDNAVAESIKRIFSTASPEHFINAFQSFYLPIVRENFPDSTKDQGVIKFLDFARSHSNLRQFVQDIMFSESNEADENPGVTLTTIHKSKGLEWENVFVTGIYDGAFPSGKTEMPDEEFRLFYVAVTRAKTNLFLTFPENSIGQWSKPTTSVFFDVLTGKVTDPNVVFQSFKPVKKKGR